MPAEMLLLKAEKARVEELEFYIKSLEEKLITAKRDGAVEELRRLAGIAEGKIGQQYVGMRRIDARYLRERADELEGK